MLPTIGNNESYNVGASVSERCLILGPDYNRHERCKPFIIIITIYNESRKLRLKPLYRHQTDDCVSEGKIIITLALVPCLKYSMCEMKWMDCCTGAKILQPQSSNNPFWGFEVLVHLRIWVTLRQ